MSIKIDVQKKPINEFDTRKVSSTEDVYKLNEVQEIKDAIQEHLLLVGLDFNNNLKTIKLVGIGSNKAIIIDSKSIVRTALMSLSDKVVLVHNHPSNSLTPSIHDKRMTCEIGRLLKTFDIELIDHVIVNHYSYMGLGHYEDMKFDYKNSDIEYTEKYFLMEENLKLKNKINELNNRIKEISIKEDEEDMEL